MNDPTFPPEMGADLFEQKPELMLAEVHRIAAIAFDDKDDILGFVAGYVARRKQREEFKSERER